MAVPSDAVAAVNGINNEWKVMKWKIVNKQ